MGFRRPILLLPEKEYSENVLKFIFLHECHHIRQKDTLYKLFWVLMQSLLWFQPLIYLLAALGNRDVEVACDEAVVEGRDMEARKEYGYALLECLRQGRERGQAYSAYFYHGKRLMEARIGAIMREDRKWDRLAYVGIAVLLLDLGLSFYRVGEFLYQRYQAGREEPLVSIYEGYELPDHFTQSAVSKMTSLEPVGEEAYREELWAEDAYPQKEYAELPYAAEGPWQVRLRDADHYSDAVGLLAQRYLSYFIDWRWAAERIRRPIRNSRGWNPSIGGCWRGTDRKACSRWFSGTMWEPGRTWRHFRRNWRGKPGSSVRTASSIMPILTGRCRYAW